MTTPDNLDPFNRLQSVIRELRAENGCPWDRKQTPATIKKYLLEETMELAEAIDRRNLTDIREELGDLYFILSMLTVMHEEQGCFTSGEVLEGICDKMIRRHPHVFEGLPTGNEDELRAQWEAIKAREKN